MYRSVTFFVLKRQRKWCGFSKGAFSRHAALHSSRRVSIPFSSSTRFCRFFFSLLLLSRVPNNLNHWRSHGHWDFDFYIFESCSLSSFHDPQIIMHGLDTLSAFATNGKLFDTDGCGDTTIEIPLGPLLNQIDASLRSTKLTGTD
jgi:hypothetical protein